MLAETELDPVGRQGLAQGLSEWPRLTRQQVLGPLHESHGGAEPVYGLRPPPPDWTAAEHDQPARNVLDPGGLAVGPNPLELRQPRNRRDHGLGAGRDDDVLRRVGSSVDRDLARPG